MDDSILEKLIEEVTQRLIFENDNFEGAVDIALDLSKQNSISPENLLEISTSLGSNGNHVLAYVFANVASSLSTGKTLAMAYSNAGLALSYIGRLDEAEGQYKLALASDQNHVATHSNYGNLFQESGRLDDAEEQYKLALVSDPNHVNTHYNYGNLLKKCGRLDDAEEQYKLALASDPNHVNTHSNYGNLLKERGRLDDAEEQYKLALASDPNDVNTHYNYGILLKERGRLDDAEEQYKLALALDPNHVNTRSNYGNLLKERGRLDDAEEQYKLALASNPNHVNTHSNYGNLLKERGRLDDAEEQYELALASNPNHVIIHYNYGNLLKERGRLDDAEEQYKLALASDPNHVNTHYNYGILLKERGRLDDAEEQYKLALALDPNHVNTRSNYGNLLKERGRLDDAEEQYKLALASDPNHVGAHSNYGILLKKRGRLDDAEEQYKLALASDPNHVNTHSNYGNLLKERGRLDDAEEQYKLALASDPNHPNAHGAYGLLLFYTNKHKKALKETKTASRLFKEESDNVMEHLSMAWLYERFADKYYKLGSEGKKENKSSGGNFRKSGQYAQLTGDEYINASKYAKEKSINLYLTKGYTLMGRGKVRKLELSLWESFILRMQNLRRYDIANFERIMLGVKNASICYKKAAEYSPENNPQCNACSDCMFVLGSIIDYMLAVIHQKTVPKLEDKIKEWDEKLSFAESVYEGESGEKFVQSLRKFIACIENLEEYKRTTTFESKELLNECMNELRNVALNIEGPLQEIIERSAQKMELCASKRMLYTGGTDIEIIENKTNFDRFLDAGKWMIKTPTRAILSLIFTVIAMVITAIIVEYIQNL